MKHIYANNTVDWYVANSRKQAVALYRKMNEGVDESELDTDFSMEPDNKELTVHDERVDAEARITKTCREWAGTEDCGFLCSTEW